MELHNFWETLYFKNVMVFKIILSVEEYCNVSWLTNAYVTMITILLIFFFL